MEPTNKTTENRVSPDRSVIIGQVLASLRGKIRQYVLVHGLMLAVVWLCASFWFGFALDYVPVMLGLSELSRPVRMILLLLIAAVLAYILYRQVFQRIMRRLTPQALALLLERRFPELNDALATVISDPQVSEPVELAGISGTEVAQAKSKHDQMLNETRSHAEATLKKMSLSEVFDFRPLLIVGLSALLLMCSVAWFATSNSDAFKTAFRRLYMLDENQWPRDCRIELVGLKVKHANSIDGIPEMNATVEFQNKRAFVGRASSLAVLVRAEMPNPESSEASKHNRRLPRLCEFSYQTTSGKRGRLPMSKIGGARDGFQSYAIEQDILQGLVEDLTFYIRGDDHRIGPFEIKAVTAPVVTRRSIDCVYPEYLVDESSSRYTSRTVDVSTGMKLPIGTSASVNVHTDRPLRSVFVLNNKGELLKRIEGSDEGQAAFNIADYRVSEPLELGLVLEDGNGVFSNSINRIQIGAELDKPPVVTSRLSGIGVAVTPDARIPIVGNIDDKNGVQKIWIELQTPLTETLALTNPPVNGALEAEIDLRQLRISGQIPSDLPTEPAGEIVLTVIAQDYFDLDGQQNVGAGTEHPLEVVTADRLLRILEREEADQRFRLEQIYREMTEARGYISRARSASANQEAGFEPGDAATQTEPGSASEDWDLRQLFLQRAILQTQKSMQEIDGVAFTFDNIRLQLVNNRIDAADRKQRLKQDVADPLKAIASQSMPALVQILTEADSVFRQMEELTTQATQVDENSTDDTVRHQADELSLTSLATVDDVLADIQNVLNSLLKFETENELLDLVRNMLEEQQALQKRTDALRNQEAFDDIFNK